MSGLFTSLAVMMSPRGLAAAGNGTGIGGVAFLGVLALAAFASIVTARNMESLGTGKVRLTRADNFVFGFLDSARLFTLTVMAVSWLGIAGYAVNEIFFLWFPNLGASFLILALAVIACIIADENGMDVFTICLTLGFCAFLYVAVMSTQPADSGAGYPTVVPGMISPVVPESLISSGPFGWLQLLFLSVFVFIGFDLPLAFENRARRAIPAVLLALLAFAAFGWAALLLDSPDRLAETTVPHLLMAGQGLGELGRCLVGGAVILISLAGVLGFFMLAGKRIESVLTEDYRKYATKGAAVLIAIIIGVLLATGWAGEDALESFISAGLCFWFGTYALIDLIHLAGLRRMRRGLFSFLPGLMAAFVHAGAAAYCALHIQFPEHFYYSLGGMAAAGLVFGVGSYLESKPLIAEIEAREAAKAEEENDIDEENESEEAVPDTEDDALKIVDYK